jgi:hypothetical protein
MTQTNSPSPEQEDHGQVLDTFVKKLMLIPDREPVASELAGALSNCWRENPHKPLMQYCNPSTTMLFDFDSLLQVPLSTMKRRT